MFRQQAKKKILVVDDEPDVLELIKSRLELNNFDVVTALNGEEGIRKAIGENPDLILLDVLMPEKNGYEVCQELKNKPETALIPIIFLTAKGRIPDIYEGIRLGASEYVVKPYNPQELLDKINQALKIT